ncbi:hypothetical protein J3F83DRAFT_728040 [Trichoderma novae-zelandiae]
MDQSIDQVLLRVDCPGCGWLPQEGGTGLPIIRHPFLQVFPQLCHPGSDRSHSPDKNLYLFLPFTLPLFLLVDRTGGGKGRGNRILDALAILALCLSPAACAATCPSVLRPLQEGRRWQRLVFLSSSYASVAAICVGDQRRGPPQEEHLRIWMLASRERCRVGSGLSALSSVSWSVQVHTRTSAHRKRTHFSCSSDLHVGGPGKLERAVF